MNQPTEDAVRALDDRDWATGGSVEAVKNSASVVFSARLRGELADWVAAEADRRGVNPSEIIRDAVAVARAAAAANEPITVTRADLHRLIDKLPAA
jgi:hypothetical protein